MATSAPFFTAFSNFPNSRISHTDAGKPFWATKKPSVSFVGTPRRTSTVYNSLTLDQDSVSGEELEKADSLIGSEVRVKKAVKVYHVPRVAEFELNGKIGVLKQHLRTYKGKRISANLPYQVEFSADDVLGRNGKPVRFIAHLREDEFELLG